MSGDDERPEREKKSWSEIDRMRDKARPSSDHEPRGRVDKARADSAAKEYIKSIDGLFTSTQGGAEGEKLAQEVRKVHGTPKLADACRAYRDAVGMPVDGALLSLFLDSGDAELVVAGLEALREGHESERIKVTSGQKTQLRTLALDSNDAIAEAAEDLLDVL